MKRGKRLLSLLLALTMMFSLFSMGGISAFAEEEGTIAPVEEPVPEGEGSIAPADGTETDAVPAPGAEPEAGGYAVGYQIDTYDANGNLSQFLIGGTVTLSKTSAADGEKVSCIVRPNSGYRLAQVMFGSEGQEPDEDVTDSLQGTMKARDMVFFVKFVAEGGTIESAGAALRIDAPGLGGSYPGGVPVSTTKYYSFPQVIAAPSSFHVENAFWRIRYGGDPTTILAGNTYYADFDLVPNDCFRFVEGFMPVVELTMPDGTVHDDGFTVTRNADGSLHVKSPDYTVPGSTDYHYLFGRVLTYDRNGNYDASLTGGTITVSTATARAGDTVSCTVSANPGYRLLMVLLAMDQDEPVEDVTETLQGTMRDYDMEFRACFIQDGGIMELPGAAVRLGYPDPNGYDSLPAVPDITKYLSQSSLAFAPSAFTVTDASWRNANGQCPGSFYASSEYYVLFTLRPNEGWAFADNFDVELTMPDGSVFESIDGDFTITRNADGSVTVKSPNTNVPSTDQPSSGLTVHFSVEVYDDDHHFLPDMNGGTASYWPAHPMPGDEVIVTATPAPGYKLQYVYYDDGVRMGYDATEEMGFTVPEDYGCLEIAVCFTRDDVELPLSQHMSLLLEQPLPGGSYSGPVPGQVLNAEGRWFDVGSVYWYGGTGSGCQGQPPASFQVGAKYYAEIVLTPHANWYFMNDNSCLLLYHDPGDADPDSYAFSAGATESVDAEGRLHIVGDEIELQSVTLREVSLGIQMFQEGGDYPQGCPVGFILPANARFTVSDAIWYNDANQESGGIGLGAGFFTRDGVYFTEFTLTPVEGCSFSEDTVVTLYEGSVKYTELYSDGSLRVCTGSFSLDPEAAAQYRRVFVTNHVLNADGSVNNSAFAGYVLPNDSRPKVGDTLIFGVAAKNGYRLQWMTAARDSEQIGEDITDELSFYVADEPGDVYVNAWFALAEEPVTCLYVDLNVQLPAPGGNYSGLAPATVTPNVVNASKYTVVSARWYELQEHGVGTPSSFVPGKQYCVEIIVAPNPGWCFGDDPGAVLSFSDGTSMDSSSGTVFPYKRDDGNLVLTSDFFTMAEVAVDSVELSLALPELGDSFVLEGRPWATFYTPHVGEMYTIWKNGADQATGAKGEQTGSFQPGCVYYATIRIHADQGYYLTADTRVTLLNDLSFTTSYSTTDRSVWIDTESIEIPGPETYTLGGDYVRFYVDGTEVTEARPGTVVEIRSDIYTIPGGKYLAQVFYGDTELEQTGLDNWSFAMPAENVTLTGVLADAETCVFELEDGVHELDALTAAWIFGSHVGGVCIEWDLNGDGQDDIRATYRDDGTAQVIRLGDIFGTIDSGLLPGRICRYIFRFGPQRYDVYLGSVQVNADNKSNIPVLGGKASYDPDTRTLNLDGYTGSIGVLGQDNFDPDLTRLFSITASGDLTITGSGTLSDGSLRGGISCGGNLTLDGDLEISAWLHGIYAAGDLRVSGSVRVTDTTQVAVGAGGNLYITFGSLRVDTDEGIGVDCRGDLTVAGELQADAGEAGVQCGGNVTLVGGTIWAGSGNDIGLIGSSDLNIQNGGFAAYGNVQAIEVASISFDTATHIIRLPVNGTVSEEGTTILDPETGDPALNVQITDKDPTIILGVKDLEGNENVGGTVAINNGDFQLEQSGSYPYGTWVTIRARAAEGYRFDHWEDEYGARPNDESDRAETSVGVFVDGILYAVFEELLPINETTFPDDNFRSYISANFDGDGDGYLSRDERDAVTAIDVSNKSIKSLVGLKHFPELVSLYCYGNPDLQEVDVRKNPQIKYLRCYNNSKLSRLYVTGCTELEVLWCNNCKLTSLQLSSCTKLKSLSCQNNDLYHLYLGQCPDLEILYCYGNANLADLSINSDALRLFYCYGTKLDTLDVSSCSLMQEVFYRGTYTQTSSYDEYTQTESGVTSTLRCNPGAAVENDLGIPINKPNFPDDDFRQYGAASFDLNKNGWLSPAEIALATSLCLEEWTDMHNVQGIHFLTELTFIMIDSNPDLTELDVSQNTKLTGLEIWGNGLTSLILGQQPAIESIYADHNALTTVDLSGAPNLLHLDISTNPLTGIDLSVTPDLKELYIYGTELAELDLTGTPILLDAYLNGTPTAHEDLGYVEYAGGPLGGRLLIDPDQVVITETAPTHTPGDITGDGKVTIADVTLLAKYVKSHGQGVVVIAAALDVNGDGRVTIADVTLLAKYVKSHGNGVVIH